MPVHCPPLSDPIQNEGWHPGSRGSPPLSGSILNEGGIPEHVYRLVFGSILNERSRAGPSGYRPYLVLSKMRGSILDKVAFPRVCFYTKGGVASRIMGPSPLSGSIQNHGLSPPI